MTKEIIETTLGDLIVALTDETGQVTDHQQEIYNLVAYILADLFRNRSGDCKGQNYEAIRAMSVDPFSWQ